MIWPDTGEFDEGLYQAGDLVYGRSVLHSGNSYTGQFKNGIKYGKGIYFWAANGTRYEGEYLHG